MTEKERRGYLDRGADVWNEDLEEDFWELTDDSLIRHHFERRFEFFYPNDSLGELPIDVSRLGDIRVTNRKFIGTVDGDEAEDHWRTQDDTPEESEKPWIGSTEFKLIPIEDELRTKKLDLEDGSKKVMTRGQKKRLAKEVQQLEDEDHAMWSVLRGQKPMFPCGWKALLEIFAGCAVLTSVFQAAGYECCTPVDILSGWDVHRSDHRKFLEDKIREERPYLLSFAWPCGPWSPWQRINKDQNGVYEKRREWIPVFKWIFKIVMEHQSRGGKTVMENPWSSEAWNTKEMEEILGLGLDTVKIDMCHFGLKDRENGKLHRKSTCIASDSPGVIRQLQNSLCRQDHVHQPLEGSNCYGSRRRQAGKYPVRYCQRLLRGVQEDLQDALCHSFHAEELLEDREEEESRGTLDSVQGPEDLGDITSGKEELPRVIEKEEDLELLDKESDPKAEALRKQEWRRLTKAERIGIRRLHHMASHATKHQMMRMLKYANAEHHALVRSTDRKW